MQGLAACLADFFDHLDGRILDSRTRPEDGLGTGVVQIIVILGWNHTTSEDDDVVTALVLQRLDQLRQQGLVTGGQRRHADGMHVVFNGLTGSFFRGLEERAHVDVEAEVGVSGCHHLGATVMAVLAELGDHDAWATAFFFGEPGDICLDLFPAFLTFHNASVNTRNGLVVGAETTEDLFQRIGHFANRGAQAHGLDGQVKQIAFAGFSSFG